MAELRCGTGPKPLQAEATKAPAITLPEAAQMLGPPTRAGCALKSFMFHFISMQSRSFRCGAEVSKVMLKRKKTLLFTGEPRASHHRLRAIAAGSS